MKAIIVVITVIAAVTEGVKVREARNIELDCEKEDGCLKACDLLFSPSHMRDENHMKYQEKHNKCIQSSSGGPCERNAQIRDCFLEGEAEVADLIDDDLESYTIYWHETIDLSN